MTDVFSSLKALHFRAPLLSAARTHAILYSQFGMTEGNAWEMESPAVKAVPLQPKKECALLSPKDLSSLFNQMIQTLNKRVFKPYGFQRSGQNFRFFRTVNGKEEGVIVNFQRSIYGDGNSTSFISAILFSAFNLFCDKFKLLIFINISGKVKNSGINSLTSSFRVVALSKVFFIEVNNLSGSSNFSPWISIAINEYGKILVK